METVISIADDVFQQAEELAAALGISRNELYAIALIQLIDQHRHDFITDRLNEVYAETESELDAVVEKLQALSLPEERW